MPEYKKNPHAVALGHCGGKKGGKARAKKLSKKELSEQGKKAATARWSISKATHSGELRIGDTIIPCAVLEDGTRVLTQRGMLRAIGRSSVAFQKEQATDSDHPLPAFLRGKSIKPYVSRELKAIGQPVTFRTIKGIRAYGYKAEILPMVCDVFLEARNVGVLPANQQTIAKKCELLMRGLARVGIAALVDEATGYQYDRARDALAKILEDFIAKELAQWAKTFPEEFYCELYRLHPKLDLIKLGNQKPQWIGKVTSNIVYDRLAPGIREELNKKNPRGDSGYRQAKHHQWLTRQSGYPKLMFHLGQVIGYMKESGTWEEFKNKLDRHKPRWKANVVKYESK